MADWAQIPDHMHMSCNSFSVGNAFGSGRGRSNATITLHTGVKLDVTNVGTAIGEMATAIEDVPELPGLRIRVGDLISVSSEGRPGIPACSNFPAALNDYFGNTYYPNMGFVGYVTNISLEADQSSPSSQITIRLEDESWKWSQYFILPIIFNRNDATKPIAYAGEQNSRRYSARKIVRFLDRLLNEYGHSSFNFSYSALPERLPDPDNLKAFSGTIWGIPCFPCQYLWQCLSSVFWRGWAC